MNEENDAPSPGEVLKPRRWQERYRWLGILMLSAFAGFGPAPPPKPPQEISGYSKIADDAHGPKVDPERHFIGET